MPKQGILFEKPSDAADMEAAAKPNRADLVRVGWQMAVLCLVATLLAAVSKDFNAKVDALVPEATTNASTFNRRQSGYSGFFELCKRSKIDVSAWELPYRDLKTHKGTLVILSPVYSLSTLEIERLAKWVREGNSLVYLDHFGFGSGRKFLQTLDIATADDSTALRDKVMNLADTEAARAVSDHVGQLTITSNQRLERSDEALIADDKGSYLIEVDYGKGQCLIGTVPTFGSNIRFSSKDEWGNLQLLLNWLRSRGGHVYFDERCHGYSASQNLWLIVSRGPVGLLVLQLFVIFVVALLSLSQRFSARRTVPIVRRISNLEYIEGLANTYQRARAYDMAYSIVFSQLRHKLQRALSITSEENEDEMATQWAEAIGERPEVCSKFLQESKAGMEDRHMTAEEFSKLINQCDALTSKSAELIGMRGSR